ncbi:MAG: cytochrome b N-terminal domain-containing protein [Kofleriaceae bacterium]|nr:cytochrome b N-terminal domain-containing protein [Kofleriaceae bacterium]
MRGFLRERVPVRHDPWKMPSGASFAYVFGSVLVFLLAVEALTGIALAAFYSPSSTDAWASVAYIQDRVALGWFVRGLHHHGGSAIVIVAGIHLLQTAIIGAYQKPREVIWWLGIVLLALVLGTAITGYWLRWDQQAYWSSQVEIGIAAGTPLVGELIRGLALGGNEAGNLTLTRAYAVHALVLPGVIAVVTIGHITLARRFGPTPLRRAKAAEPRWPAQTLRDVVAMAIVFVVLLAFTVSQGGVDLGAPAEPTAAYDARPLWPMRWLFELRVLAGSAEQLAAMLAPAVFGGFLIALPLLDRGMKRRKVWLGALAGVVAVIGALSVMSYARDASDDVLAERRAKAEARAHKARQLAVQYGVPATGAHDVFMAPPMMRARTLFASRCEGCHAADSKDRKGPVIAAGHGNRAWLTAFLQAPSGDEFWGRTKLAKTEAAMKPVEMAPQDLADLVEMLYAESGASDVDAEKKARGATVFDAACTDCHAREEGMPGASGPGMSGLNSRAWYLSFISNPKSAFHMGADKSQMPRFDGELTLADRDALAEYLVWLRTATPADVAKLPAL